MTNARIGVCPVVEWRSHERLLAVIEAAYPVRFEGVEHPGRVDLDGIVHFGADAGAANGAQIPTLVMVGPERAAATTARVAIGEDERLDPSLRGAALGDAWSEALDVEHRSGANAVLGSLDGVPAWVAHGRRDSEVQVVATAPAELGAHEGLRDRLSPGRCLALLALVQFVRQLAAGRRWEPPPLRATFVLDDPNLHWPSYGHVRYDELSRHASEHRYHVSIAMVPLDGWLAHPRVVRLFRERSAQLSVCVHGNNHHGAELGRIDQEDIGAALANQALQRSAAFRQRTGIDVEAVMVPPHERLSEPAARALMACGYEAVCASRPYPWFAATHTGSRWAGPPEARSLAGWRPRELVAGGLPLLLRAGVDAPAADWTLRAFLGQPLVLYGHHDLLENGPQVLAEAAAVVNAIGDVTWCSLGDLARAGVETRRHGEELDARVLARRTKLELPAGVRRLHVNSLALALPSGTQLRTRLAGPQAAQTVTELGSDGWASIDVGGALTAELTFSPPERPARLNHPRRTLGTVMRRLANEGRDRAQAIRVPAPRR
jgi:hypothetical protein